MTTTNDIIMPTLRYYYFVQDPQDSLDMESDSLKTLMELIQEENHKTSFATVEFSHHTVR